MQLKVRKYCKEAGAKAAIMLLVIAMVTIAFVSMISAAPGIIYGDVNLDGTIDVRDVVLVMQYVVGIGDLSEDQFKAADVNGDGSVDVQDVTMIMRHVLKIESLSRSVSAVELIEKNVTLNTAVENLNLPGTVKVTMSDNSVEELKVEWEVTSNPPYTKDEVGEYLFEGELVDLPPGVTNSENLKAQAIINVLEDDTPVTPEPDLSFKEMGGEIVEIVIGVFNVSLPYNIADSAFTGVTQNSTIVLNVDGKDPLYLEYNDVRDAFFKPAVQGYFEDEIENAKVNIN